MHGGCQAPGKSKSKPQQVRRHWEVLSESVSEHIVILLWSAIANTFQVLYQSY